MKKIHLIIGIHNHQPVGNFDFVFEEAYRKAYQPFLELLQQFPAVKVSMHYTGIVLDWIYNRYPELIQSLQAMTQSGQIEMMGGGFYEPILSVIPDHDKLGQINKLSRYLKETIDAEPVGMWMAERIWEPHLPKILAQAGMKYTILDDTHFQYVGLKEDELQGYYITEEDGYAVNLFPISKKLRYTIPFQEPEKTIEYLRSLATESGDRIATFADDGEKFGIWPGTFKHCYVEGWLERFFQLLTENSDWIRIIHFREALKTTGPLGRIYLPTASYAEMQHWALPVRGYQEYETFENKLKHLNLYDDYTIYVRGGFWRNFMVKYDEANRMHKKMRHISHRVQMLQAVVTAGGGIQNPENGRMLEMAQDHLWAAQCNCPYWHGVFGGIYLNHIRYAIYRQLLLAEKLLDTVEYGDDTSWQHTTVGDFNQDGYDEVIIETKHMNLYLDIHRGGTLFAIDYKVAPINLGDTMTRREEGYHQRLIEFNRMKNQPRHAAAGGGTGEKEIPSIHDLVQSKEENLDRFLIYDRYLRNSLTDRLIPEATTLDEFYREQYREYYPLGKADYDAEDLSKNGHVSWRLTHDIKTGPMPILLQKTVSLTPGQTEMTIAYELINKSAEPLRFCFGTEFNLTLLAGNADNRYYYADGPGIADRKLNSFGETADARFIGMIDEWLNINLSLRSDRRTTFWRFPVETISLSEEGFERVYQNSCIFPHWNIYLKPNQRWNVQLVLHIKRNV